MNKNFSLFLAGILIIVGYFILVKKNDNEILNGKEKTSIVDTRNSFKVLYVSDGDTIAVTKTGTNQKYVLRLMGVNTPEVKKPNTKVECFGEEASNFMKKLLPKYSEIKVRFLLNQKTSKPVLDKFNRNIAYIYLLNQKYSIQTQLLKNGFAREYSYKNYYYPEQKYYRFLENNAKKAKVGLWGKCFS